MDNLAEGCIASILSGTNPVDTCRLSLVSKAFCSAAQYNVVWNRFLPSDLNSILDRSDSKSSLLASPSKKALFLTLSDHPILLDNASMSFHLDKRSGKKCYMVAPRHVHIIWGDTPQYWNWINIPDSRFPEVAELRAVCWFHISWDLSTLELSPGTDYGVYIVFKMQDAVGFDHYPMELCVGIVGEQNASTRYACLDPSLEEGDLNHHFQGLQLERPRARTDGWLEIEMGHFFTSPIRHDRVAISIAETRSNMWKNGFVLQGFEFRPRM